MNKEIIESDVGVPIEDLGKPRLDKRWFGGCMKTRVAKKSDYVNKK